MFTCVRGNVEIAKLLLEEGANANLSNASGMTALMVAVVNDHLPLVKLLLESNADLTLRNKKNVTAVELAKSEV